MSEWLKEHAWKACVGETLPWVRIPLSPPAFRPIETATALAPLNSPAGHRRRPRREASCVDVVVSGAVVRLAWQPTYQKAILRWSIPPETSVAQTQCSGSDQRKWTGVDELCEEPQPVVHENGYRAG